MHQVDLGDNNALNVDIVYILVHQVRPNHLADTLRYVQNHQV